jgi:predicted ATP-dependent protease
LTETQPAWEALRLKPEQVRRTCAPESFSFSTTAEIEPHPGLLGQSRAGEALAFGVAMAERTFNIYVAGAEGTGRTTAVRRFLQAEAAKRPTPPDWCYVYNFKEASRPRALRLPAGKARQLRDDLRALVRAARREIPRAFESEEYVSQRETIMADINRRREQNVEQITAQAQRLGFPLQMTPMGIGVVPVLGNRPLTEEELAGLGPEMRAAIAQRREELDESLSAFAKQMRAIEREAVERVTRQDRDVALRAVGGLVEDVVERYEGIEPVATYLAELRDGILGEIDLFRGHPIAPDGSTPGPVTGEQQLLRERAFRKYEINVVVDNAETQGAPVVADFNPTYPNLLGRIEREVVLGALVTDFTLISAGSLQHADGGYLVLRLRDLLRAPMAWDALKRALREGSAAIEDMGDMLGMTGARGLRPDPIPIEVKVCLIGDPATYLALYEMDPDFRTLFKVRVDFDSELPRTPENELEYARFLRSLTEDPSLPLDPGGVAHVIEESSRLADDQRKLSTRYGEVTDLISEAQYWARADGAAAISADHVRRAVEQRRRRAGMIPERLNEMVARGVLLIRPQGEAVGQIHGLAVVGGGDVVLGRPTRITATVGAGRDGVVDIERQVELGGPIHSKGLLILSGYLTDTYARSRPLALSARLVFEQSYEPVEGDSASLAELLTLLSRLAGASLNQAIAVTGSVNQRGEVQAVGGVNQKIEGYFDTCAGLGFTGEQGVILPRSNVENLMLRDDVVEAVRDGRFRIFGVTTVDEALSILTGGEAGVRNADGAFPDDSIHARVDARLEALAGVLREYAEREADGRARTAASVASRLRRRELRRPGATR